MRSLQVAVLVSAVALSATDAGAQFGLYGSPEMLNLSRSAQYGGCAPCPTDWREAAPYGGYVSPRSYPARPGIATVQTAATAPYVAAPSPQYAGPAAASMPPVGYRGLPAEPAPPEAPSLPPGLSQGAAPTENPPGVDPIMSGGGDDPVYSGQGAPGDSPQGDVPEGGPCGCFTRALNGFVGAACGGLDPWYASVSALVMSRDEPNRLWTTYQSGNEPNQIPLVTPFEWRWGGEIRFGRRFCCCGSWAVEAAYWTLDPLDSYATVTDPSGVSTTLTVGNVFFGGYPATQWFDHALEHRLQRRDEVHSIEVSLIRYRVFSTAELPWEVSWSLGARFFRFEEGLTFSSVADPANLGDPSMNAEAFLDDHITNNLVGFQFGFDADYYLSPNWRVFAAPKFGIYNNHIEHRFQAYLGDGTGATQNEYPGMTYPVNSTKDVVSFLTQIDLGLEWQFAPRWNARIGYRLVAVTGVGLADNQIPQYIVDIPELANIDSNGDLILHGAFVGLTYNF
jgi:hypothetical protein